MCWGVTRDYPPAATKPFEEFGQVTGARALVEAGACSWETVAAGKHHACGITAEPPGGFEGGLVGGDVYLYPPGTLRCWGSDEHGQSTPPTRGVTLPWRGWPAVSAAESGSQLSTLSTRASGQCAAVASDGGSRLGGRVVAIGAAVLACWALGT